MVDFLVFVKTLIQVALARWWWPEYVPFVRLSGGETTGLKHWSNEFVVESQHLVQEFTILNVVRLLVAIELHVVGYHLFVWNVLEHKEIWLVLVVVVVRLGTASLVKEALGASVRPRHGWVHGPVRNSGRRGTRRSCSVWLHAFEFIFEVLQLAHNFTKLALSFFLLDGSLSNCEHPLAIDEVTSTWSSGILTVDTLPVLFEIWLNMLESIESRHLTWLLLRRGLRWYFALSYLTGWLRFSLLLRIASVSILSTSLFAAGSFFVLTGVMSWILTNFQNKLVGMFFKKFKIQ